MDYTAVRPLHVYVGDPVSVIYFPYVPALDRDKKALRRAFRSDMKEIAAAVADFNGHNLVQLRPPWPGVPGASATTTFRQATRRKRTV